MRRHECAQRIATEAGGRGYPIPESPTSNPVTPGDRPAGSRLTKAVRRRLIGTWVLVGGCVAAAAFGILGVNTIAGAGVVAAIVGVMVREYHEDSRF